MLLHKTKKIKQLFFIILVITTVVTACKKKESDLGLNLLSDSDQFNFISTDTISVNISTSFEDSLETDERSVVLLGSYMDPVFGLAQASIVTQIGLSTENVNFNNSTTNPVADSLILYPAHTL